LCGGKGVRARRRSVSAFDLVRHPLLGRDARHDFAAGTYYTGTYFTATLHDPKDTNYNFAGHITQEYQTHSVTHAACH